MDELQRCGLDAKAVPVSKGWKRMYVIRLTTGEVISGEFASDLDAWEDAAVRIREYQAACQKISDLPHSAAIDASWKRRREEIDHGSIG
jgi:hypothetical protein